MRKINVVVVIMLLLSGFVAFGQQSARDYQNTIEDLNKEIVNAMISGNTEKSLSFFTDDVISMPNYGPMLQGIDEVRKANEDMGKSGVKIISFKPEITKVIPNGDQVTEIGTYRISMIMPGSDEPVEDHGKYLNIWERQSDGSLKIKVETWNSDSDPMEQMGQMEE
jgi:ketosteroid isomerase-like protein